MCFFGNEKVVFLADFESSQAPRRRVWNFGPKNDPFSRFCLFWTVWRWPVLDLFWTPSFGRNPRAAENRPKISATVSPSSPAAPPKTARRKTAPPKTARRKPPAEIKNREIVQKLQILRKTYIYSIFVVYTMSSLTFCKENIPDPSKWRPLKWLKNLFFVYFYLQES